jgi:glycosyltransferase involved in cell wall biosynthesis
MLISIITPSKNQGQFIKHCMDSIHFQNHKEIEHLVIDGLSTDDTVRAVEGYPSLFIQERDSGPAQAINRGLDLATGEIICWLNADDAFAGPEVLQQVAEIFLQHPDIDVITGDGYYIDDGGRRIYPIVPDHPSRMSYAWMRRSDPFLQPATFWRRNQFRLDESLHYTFDWQLWLDFYGAGLNICYVPKYFALYRIQSGSLTQQDRPLRRKEIYDVIAKYGDSAFQRQWCWIVWKSYVLDWKLHTSGLRKAVKILNSLLSQITVGRISWG